MRSTPWIAAAFALVMATPAVAQEPADADNVDADSVIAVVDGTEITLGHMIQAREQVPQQFQQLPDETLFDAILEQLIQQTALADAATGPLPRRDRVALDNETRSRTANLALTRRALDTVDDAMLRDAYAERYADASPEQEYNASHILVETREAAEELAEALAEGADFGELAQEHSADGTAASGGDLGWFGPGMMVAPFEEAVMALEPGEISAPVETQFGWHIVRLDDTRTAEVPEFDDIRGELEQQLQREAAEALIAEVTEAAEITRMREGIDPALLRESELLQD